MADVTKKKVKPQVKLSSFNKKKLANTEVKRAPKLANPEKKPD